MRTAWLPSFAVMCCACSALVAGVSITPSVAQEEAALMVDVKRRTTDEKWQPKETRTLAHLADQTWRQEVELSPYGGLKSATVEKTGFFHAREIDGRWWLIDPDGSRFRPPGYERTNWMLRLMDFPHVSVEPWARAWAGAFLGTKSTG